MNEELKKIWRYTLLQSQPGVDNGAAAAEAAEYARRHPKEECKFAHSGIMVEIKKDDTGDILFQRFMKERQSVDRARRIER